MLHLRTHFECVFFPPQKRDVQTYSLTGCLRESRTDINLIDIEKVCEDHSQWKRIRMELEINGHFEEKEDREEEKNINSGEKKTMEVTCGWDQRICFYPRRYIRLERHIF